MPLLLSSKRHLSMLAMVGPLPVLRGRFEYLRGGIWSKFLKASKEMDGPDEGPQIFTGDFGIAFELTCRDLAREAKAHPKFIGALELSKAPGTQDEIEDVVFREGDSAALFSAKARLMKEPVARQAIERSKVIEWYYEFFFDKKTVKKGKKFRVGVLRLRSEEHTSELQSR